MFLSFQPFRNSGSLLSVFVLGRKEFGMTPLSRHSLRKKLFASQFFHFLRRLRCFVYNLRLSVFERKEFRDTHQLRPLEGASGGFRRVDIDILETDVGILCNNYLLLLCFNFYSACLRVFKVYWDVLWNLLRLSVAVFRCPHLFPILISHGHNSKSRIYFDALCIHISEKLHQLRVAPISKQSVTD